MTTRSRYPSRITSLDDMKNHYVFIVNQKFHGYEPDSSKPNKADWELRFYSQSEVRDIVRKSFKISDDFIENEISEKTTMLVVPDNWDRKLPLNKMEYAKRLIYIPFSYVLHPAVVNLDEMVHLTAPPNAEYQIMLREQNRYPDKNTFELDPVAADEIMERFQGWQFNTMKKQRDFEIGFKSHTPNMVPEKVHHRPWNAPIPTSKAKKTSISKKKELPVIPLPSKKKPSTLKTAMKEVGDDIKEFGQKIKKSLERPAFKSKKPEMSGKTPSMNQSTRKQSRASMSYSSDDNDDDNNDKKYQEEWAKIVKQAKKMQTTTSFSDSD